MNQPSNTFMGRSEADILAGMMGADARRVDALVHDVGEVKGHVHALRGDVGRMSDGVDELRGAMAVLSRHSLLMEGITTDLATTRSSQADLDRRVRVIELDMPALKETRGWVVRAVLVVAGMVGIALVGLVLIKA